MAIVSYFFMVAVVLMFGMLSVGIYLHDQNDVTEALTPEHASRFDTKD